MSEPRHVRVYYCTDEARRFMATLPMDGLLRQGSTILPASEFSRLESHLTHGRPARIDGRGCWFEYEVVGAA